MNMARRILVIATFSACSFSSISAAEPVENWHFRSTVLDMKGSTLEMVIDEDRAMYTMGGTMMTLQLTGSEAEAIGTALREITADDAPKVGQRIAGGHRIEVSEEDGNTRITVREDRDVTMDMAIMGPKEAKKFGAALKGAAARLTDTRARITKAMAESP